MTERALPQIGIGARPAVRATDTAGTVPVVAPAARAVTKSPAIFTTATRAGVLVGASAAIYAVSLAGVASFQAQADAAVVAARAPYVDEVSSTRAANDALEAALVAADAQARALANDYANVGGDVTDYQARLDALAALVADVQGSAAALPTRIALPSVSMHGAIAGVSRSSGGGKAPSTSATTSASGG